MDDAGGRFAWAWLSAAAGLSLALHLGGVKKALPVAPEVDEAVFVERAASIASTGSLNPGWFGHPGSTTIYPLAAAYGVCAALLPGEWRSSRTGPSSAPPAYYYLGRLLSIAYGAACVPLAYLAGRRAFGVRVGAAGACLSAFSPLAVQYGQVVRSDTAALFFGTLALWACLRLYDRPGLAGQCLAGACIGLAVASRYFMAALVPLLAAVDVSVWRRGRAGRVFWAGAAAGAASAAAAFALATPYFFLDFGAAWRDLVFQARPAHLGHDGLTLAGNCAWYLARAVPVAMTWPQAILVPVGVACVLAGRAPKQLLLLGYAAVFLFALCLSSQHWDRWLIQIVPVLSLFSARGAWACAGIVSRRGAVRGAAFACGILALMAAPVCALVGHDVRAWRPTTELQARAWAIRALPAGSRIAQEWYTAPLDGAGFTVERRYTLAEGRTVDDYARAGFRCVMASSAMYDRYDAEPLRYPREVAFYRELARRGALVARFDPSWVRGGPVVLVYALPAPAEAHRGVRGVP